MSIISLSNLQAKLYSPSWWFLDGIIGWNNFLSRHQRVQTSQSNYVVFPDCSLAHRHSLVRGID